MKRRIVRWDNNAVIWEGVAETVKDALRQAIAADVNLSHAYLTRANLTYANLTRANLTAANLTAANLTAATHVRLPTGETLEEYFAETVPALLVSGGKTLESFADHWDCHDWTNCPMAHAFDAKLMDDVPILLRPRAEQFVRLFDARQIPWIVVQAAIDRSATDTTTRS